MFDKDFIFGASTAAYQIEGYTNIDGRTDSIWDTFSRIEGKIDDGSDGTIACESYKKYKEDVKLLKELKVNGYRFSISWSRVINRNNKPNKKGINYYVKLAKELNKYNIKPYVTLYHWDMPQWLEDKGGFLNDQISDYFEYYTDVITKALDGLVSDYITINEPQCIMHLGHNVCVHAPGTKYNDKDMIHAIHNLLLCHGKSVRVIRKNVKNSTVGFAPCSRPMIPTDKSEEAYRKCYDKYFELDRGGEYPNNVSIYSDPIFLGDYPKEYYVKFKDILPNITKEDLELISQPLDYIYQNIYSGTFYKIENNEAVMKKFPFGYPEGNIDWLQVVPEALYYAPKYLYERYKKPIIISENGFCNNDLVSEDGKVHDAERIEYLKSYLKELERVSKEIEVKGYFVWSLLDNFEWHNGLRKRFGLVYVDYSTGERIKKDSFYFYKKLIKENKQ